MPAYWFMYNMYALARNAWKYIRRDKRIDKTQLIEYDYPGAGQRERNVRCIANDETIHRQSLCETGCE